MSHKRKIVLLLVLSLSLLALTSVQAQDEQVTIRVIGLRVTPEEAGSPLDLARQEVIANFEEANPTIDIDPIETPPDFDTQLLVDLAAGTAPEVWYQDASTAARLVDTGNILDMNVCLDLVPELTLDRFSPTFLGIHQRDTGEIWGLPDGGTPMVMYYNPEAFERAGVDLPTSDWTWDEFLDVVQRLTLDSEGRNSLDPDFDAENVMQWGFRVRQYIFEWIYWVWANGGDVISPDGSTVDGYLNSPESIETITFLRDLITEYGVAPEPSALDQINQQFGFLTAFLQGDVAIFPRGHWEMVGLLGNEAYEPGRVAVVGNPVKEADATVIYESGWFINKAVEDDPAKLEAACKFVTTLTDVPFQSTKVITGLEISANAEAAQNSVEESSYPEIEQVFVDEVANGRRPYGSIYANWPIVEQAIDLMMENILAGGDIEEEVALAVEEIDRELARAQRDS
ncbi:MAG: sugar ABC transporter substrate-binding protein [Anaerolineae bacterium]|nr:sugar ABC transporter substrate-binding protein [Anaerolineae bacterium]